MLGKMKKSISTYSYPEMATLIISVMTAFLLTLLTAHGDDFALLRTHIFWDFLFDGNIEHFYDFRDTGGILGNVHNCNLLDRLPLLLWYLPSWIVTKLAGGGNSLETYTTFYHLMWHKLFLAIMCLLCIKSMIEICKVLNSKEMSKYCVLLMAVSPGLILSVFFCGQDEIIYITFFVIALEYYAKGNQKRYYFWAIWSALSCPLMLMPYLFITILDDKQLYSIIGKLVLPIIPQLLYSLFFSQCMVYRYTTASDYIRIYFTTNNISMGYGTFSILAVVLILLFTYAYLYRPDLSNVKEKVQILSYMIALIFASLTTLAWESGYRNFLWVPFAILFAVNLEDSIRCKLCLAIVSCMDMLQTVRVFYTTNLLWSGDGRNRLTVLGYKILGSSKYFRFPLLLNKSGIEVVMLNSLMMVCLLLFFYFGKKKSYGRLELQLELHSVIFLCSLVLPLLLIYSFLCAYLIG